jgi:uncharacterized protein HemX
VPENITNIILAIVAGLFGAGGIVAYYKAQTDRRKIIEDAEAQHEKVMAEAHDVTSKTVISAFRELTATLQERLDVVTCKINELETQLERERNRAGVLERKVQMLEREREEWRRERASLIARIAELEACR